MDKDFIMKLDDDKDLLTKEKPLLGFVNHPIPFSLYRSVIVNKADIPATVLDAIKDYTDRTFLLLPKSYGVEVSINYDEGLFQSMILKGTGEAGERVSDHIALQLVPKEAKSKNKITLHALLTLQDKRQFRGGVEKHEVPKVLKQAIMQGLAFREDREIVCRPYRLFVDGKDGDPYDIWEHIGGLIMAGLNILTFATKLEKDLEDFVNCDTWLIPTYGLILRDEQPQEEGAFPETHFVINEDDITEPSP
jgi:hypothetical protein